MVNENVNQVEIFRDRKKRDNLLYEQSFEDYSVFTIQRLLGVVLD